MHYSIVRMKAGVFGHNGLGDGVNILVLSNNLHLNGWQVDTYNNVMGSMQRWFPHLPVFSYPPLSELSSILQRYDRFFVVHNDTDPFVQKLIEEGKRRDAGKIQVIYLYPSKHIVHEKYYADCLTEPALSIADNLRLFCERVLHLQKSTKSNGFIPPAGLVSRKHGRRVVIHPTSARITRNWPQEKFLEIAFDLKDQGYLPVFIPGDAAGWHDLGVETLHFPSLDALACYIYESGYLIGNDSGLGHLASALGVPTLTICRRRAWANMWAPSFQKGVVVTPPRWIPNIRGLRFRDRYWRFLISVSMAKRAFLKLVKGIPK